MQGLKVSLGAAAFGFLLSLLFGFFSHAAFFIILLRALIIALVFAGLGFALYFVSDKFLLDDSDGTELSSEPIASSNPQVGTKVDIYVRDEELDSDEGGNPYLVDDSSRQMLNSSDLRSTGSASKEASEPPAAGKAFASQTPPEQKAALSQAVPAASEGAKKLPPAEPAPVASPPGRGTAAAELRSESAGEAESPEKKENSSELDTLPDMSAFTMEGGSTASDENDDDEAESDASYTTTVSSGHRDGSEYGVRDAEVMAKAISSVLSREDS